jgi:hypothetical protein
MTDDTITFVRQFTNEDGTVVRRYSDSKLAGRTHDVTVGSHRRKEFPVSDAQALATARSYFANVRRCQS